MPTSLIQSVADFDMRIVDANSHLAEMLQIPEAKLLGTSVIDVTHKDDWQVNREQIEALRRQGRPFAMTKRYLRADSTPIWTRVHAALGETDSGKPTLRGTIELLSAESIPAAAPNVAGIADVEWMLKIRALQSAQFTGFPAREAMLDILLVLSAREARGVKSTVTTACAATALPYASSHRRYIELVELGLVSSMFDPHDGRQILVRLTEAGHSTIKGFLGAVPKLR